MKRLSLTLALATLISSPALAKGPPWISVEFRARPVGEAGFLLVRTFHHGDAMPLPIHGTAEGLSAGRRVSVPLRFDQLGDEGVYVVPRSWGEGGPWVLNIAVADEHIGAGAVVGIGRDGEPAFVRFPRTAIGATRPASQSEVAAMLAALDAAQPPPTLGRSGWSEIVLRLAVPLAVLMVAILAVVKLLAMAIGRLRARRPVLQAAR